jgi:hypothetical protein
VGLAVTAIGLFSSPASASSVLYVDDDAAPLGDGSSWSNAYRFLQDALAAAAASGGMVNEIRVAQGVYTPILDESDPDGYSTCCQPSGGIGCDDAACEANVCSVLPLCCAVEWGVDCVALALELCTTLCTEPRLATFQLLDGVSLLGGYAGPGEPDPDARDPDLYVTVVSGDLAGNDDPDPTGSGFLGYEENSYSVVTGSDTGPTAVIDGFWITAGNANGPDDGELEWIRGGGMWNLTGSPTITNCRFECNHASGYGGGMYNRNSSSPDVSACTFAGNVAGIKSGGMHNYGDSNPTVTDCEFTGNATIAPNAGAGGAMRNSTNCSPTVSNCTFTGNDAHQGGAIEFYDGSHGTVTDCTFTDNTSDLAGAIIIFTDSSPRITNCLFQDNVGPDNAGAILNHTNCDPVIEDCTFTGNMGFIGAVHNAENSNPTIENCQFIGNVASQRGGAIANTVSSSLVTSCTFSGNSAGTFNGGGVINDGGAPTFLNCTFEGNTAGQNGGGMHNRNGSAVILQTCTFTNNIATDRGGGLSNKNCDPQVAGCDFIGNTAPIGGGMANVTASPLVTTCEFHGNQTTDLGPGGGMSNSTGSSPVVTNSLFAGNSAHGNGGAIANEIDSSPEVTNCTIVNNTTGLAGGGIRSTDAAGGHCAPVVTNCIVRGNSDGQIVDEAGAVTTVSYSNVEGGFARPGNIDADPQFQDPGADDYRLGGGSPSIDAADNAAMSEVADLDGNPRFVDDPDTVDTGVPGNGYDEIVDMGAYEFQLLCPCDCEDPPDGAVDVGDFLALLAQWGGPGPCDCEGPPDGVVDVGDFLALLANWGPCP